MRISKVPIFVALLLIVASLAGCGSSSSESTDKSVPSQESTPSGTASQLPIKIEGIKEQVCTSGYFFLDFRIKNISTSKLDFSDLKDLGLEVLLMDESDNKLVTLPVSFYGSLTPGLNVNIEPNSGGILTVVNDGFKGTLDSVEVQVNGNTIYEAPADFPAPARGRNWVIKDGICG
jgi:archaellum component FlaG (FlaF/FlaG flagellin family)